MMKEIDGLDIAKAAKEAEEMILEQLEKGDKKEHIFTKAFEEQMSQLITGEKQLKFKGLMRKIGIAILIIGIAGSLGMSVEAVRTRVIEFITEVFEKFTSISYQSYGAYDNEREGSYLPQYVPEGFEMIEEEKIFNDVHITYENELGEEILFRQIEITTNNSIIDTEKAQLEKICLEDKEYYYYENKEIKNIMWIEGVYQITISSEIEKDELIKMCLSVQ